MAEIKYEITEHLGLIGEGSKGWTKELNLVSWNDRSPKYDLRDWAPEHAKMGKGITLTQEELKSLRELLNQLELD
ncbi:YdbC family protein [Anoxynatronum sibiricum]|uniref:YdbC family protein n=1 Tax=Anoxynatronum sibiricum TaxID=210623 RepID=A0ABU9W042_9CLOT